ncbi:hypothetical protein Tco_0987851 [Tanacetum coccineum]
MKAINIILQGLPTEIYSLVNHHRVAKDLWEKVQLLMQGTSLTKQERECKLYDAFDKFAHIKGESLHQYSASQSCFFPFLSDSGRLGCRVPQKAPNVEVNLRELLALGKSDLSSDEYRVQLGSSET